MCFFNVNVRTREATTQGVWLLYYRAICFAPANVCDRAIIVVARTVPQNYGRTSIPFRRSILSCHGKSLVRRRVLRSKTNIITIEELSKYFTRSYEIICDARFYAKRARFYANVPSLSLYYFSEKSQRTISKTMR